MLRRSRASRRRPTEGSTDQRLRALVGDHVEAIYRVALSVVRDPALAEDVTQETVIKAWQSLGTYRGEGSERAWILRIAHNTAVSTLRRIRDEATDPGMLPEEVDTTELLKAAVEHKVAFVPGGAFHPNGGGKNTMRLNFSYCKPEVINEGIKRLGDVLRLALEVEASKAEEYEAAVG